MPEIASMAEAQGQPYDPRYQPGEIYRDPDKPYVLAYKVNGIPGGGPLAKGSQGGGPQGRGPDVRGPNQLDISTVSGLPLFNQEARESFFNALGGVFDVMFKGFGEKFGVEHGSGVFGKNRVPATPKDELIGGTFGRMRDRIRERERTRQGGEGGQTEEVQPEREGVSPGGSPGVPRDDERGPDPVSSTQGEELPLYKSGPVDLASKGLSLAGSAAAGGAAGGPPGSAAAIMMQLLPQFLEIAGGLFSDEPKGLAQPITSGGNFSLPFYQDPNAQQMMQFLQMIQASSPDVGGRGPDPVSSSDLELDAPIAPITVEDIKGPDPTDVPLGGSTQVDIAPIVDRIDQPLEPIDVPIDVPVDEPTILPEIPDDMMPDDPFTDEIPPQENTETTQFTPPDPIYIDPVTQEPTHEPTDPVVYPDDGITFDDPVTDLPPDPILEGGKTDEEIAASEQPRTPDALADFLKQISASFGGGDLLAEFAKMFSLPAFQGPFSGQAGDLQRGAGDAVGELLNADPSRQQQLSEDTLNEMLRTGGSFDLSPEFEALETRNRRRLDEESAKLNELFGGLGARFGTDIAKGQGELSSRFLEAEALQRAQLTRDAFEASQGRRQSAVGQAQQGQQQQFGQQLAGNQFLNQLGLTQQQFGDAGIQRMLAEFGRTQGALLPLMLQLLGLGVEGDFVTDEPTVVK